MLGKDYQLRPKDPYRERPTVYAGGESEPARDLAASSADVYFINGQPLFEVQRLIEDVKQRPRTGSELRFGLSAFVIARETDEEAQQALDEAWKLSEKDKDNRAKIFGNAASFIQKVADRQRATDGVTPP